MHEKTKMVFEGDLEKKIRLAKALLGLPVRETKKQGKKHSQGLLRLVGPRFLK